MYRVKSDLCKFHRKGLPLHHHTQNRTGYIAMHLVLVSFFFFLKTNTRDDNTNTSRDFIFVCHVLFLYFSGTIAKACRELANTNYVIIC